MEMEIQTVMKRNEGEEDLPPQFSSTELFSYFIIIVSKL
jgi:hypothetical protein